MKLLKTALFGLILSTTLNAIGADNLVLLKYEDSSKIPLKFLEYIDGTGYLKSQYLADDGKIRTDKVYYLGNHSYKTTYRFSDIHKMLDPKEGKLSSLFEETTLSRTTVSGLFNTMMRITTPLKNFDCSSKLNFQRVVLKNKIIYWYDFSDFNMVFNGIKTRVEVEEIGSVVSIRLDQLVVVKGSTYAKLKKYMAVTKFETNLRENLKTFKKGLGAI